MEEIKEQALIDFVRHAIPEIRTCARVCGHKAAKSKLLNLARTFEDYLPETLQKEQQNEAPHTEVSDASRRDGSGDAGKK